MTATQYHTIEMDIRESEKILFALCLDKQRYQNPSFLMKFFTSPHDRMVKIKELNEKIVKAQQELIKLKLRKKYRYFNIIDNRITLN